jgi:TonB-linked SusC/RagA family outer membrane protein
MKYIKIKIIICALLVGGPIYSFAQNDVPDNDFLLNNDTVAVKKDIVQLIFHKVNKKDLLGGVTEVNVAGMLDKNYTTYSLDNMDDYVGGFNGNMWGRDSYLVLVDGVPRDANNVLPSEIDKITFLKGAQAVVLYGSNAAKGVIYITTKRGEIGKQYINVRANTGFYVPKCYPKYLGSAEYMSLYNEARTNDGLTPLYSADDIYNYASGKDIYRYPNVNMYSSEYLKKLYNYSDATAEISGGNRRARYYTNIGLQNTSTQYKIGEARNNHTTRFNVRGNIDITISDWISAWVDANATFYDNRSANGNFWSDAAKFRPNRVSPLIPISDIDGNDATDLSLVANSDHIIDGKYLLGGTQLDPTNPIADMYASGYNTWTSRQFQSEMGVNMDLNSLLKGLSFRTMFSIDYATSYSNSYTNTYASFYPTWNAYSGKDMISSFTQYGKDSKSGVDNVSNAKDNQTLSFSGQFNYNRTFNHVHNLSAILLATGYQQTKSGVYHRVSNANLGLQVDYNYLEKYYVNFASAAIHSAKMAPGKRNAFSPSLTLGWRLSNDFFKDSPVVDDLMLSASASILHSDLDFSDYYMYQGYYTQSNGTYWGWNDGNSTKSTDSRRGENDELTFVKIKEFSVNVRTSLWKKLLTADASFFVNNRSGLPVSPSSTYPNYFSTYYPSSSFIPYINYNGDRRTGIDFNVNFNKSIEDVDFTLGLCGMYYTTKWTKVNEIYANSYQYNKGKQIDGIWGLRSKGLYQDQNDIKNSPTSSFGTVQPGDIKYVDQNGDGKIDSNDQVFLGRYDSPFNIGINLTTKWKDFTLFILGSGYYGGHGMKNSSYYWVYGDGKYSDVVRGRWTAATAKTATYPILTTGNNPNDFQNSDFWIYSTDRFTLNRVQITYDLPERILHKSFIHKLSAYISGASLLTISKERKIQEMNVGSAPQTRYYDLGVKMTF